MKINIQFDINSNIFLRDPQETKLGMKIIINSIELINELGFESFTFKKLAEKIESTEASIYRYFENKNRLLNYLIALYWEWISIRIDFSNSNIPSPKMKLKNIIKVLANSFENQIETEIDEKKLHSIVGNEGIKIYHFKDIDEENKKGNFINYKKVIVKITQIISEIKSDCKYPNSMATLLVDTAINHSYYAEHLPTLVNLSFPNIQTEIEVFLLELIEKQLEITFK